MDQDEMVFLTISENDTKLIELFVVLINSLHLLQFSIQIIVII